MLENWHWTWPAIALALLLSALVARWFLQRVERTKRQRVNPEYFKGLNFLLNEETDKAIDVFMRALEVDNDTVELHLALGGLFRRQGQLDRATRIHQNLIARPTLTDDQRLQALHELAQDYYKVGWLDRAENLFLELKEAALYRSQAISGLCKIYQQEKEWQKAIRVLREHARAERKNHSKQIAHYFCEMAETAVENRQFPDARRFLAEAETEDSASARVKLLRGQLASAEGDYATAVHHWQAFSRSHPEMRHLAVANVIEAFQSLGDYEGLEDYLLESSSVPRDKLSFLVWYSALTDLKGREQALELILQRVHAEGLSSPVAAYLYTAVREGSLSVEHCDKLLRDLLEQAKNHKIEYTCLGCGFATKAMYWFCPNCGEWESFR